MRKISTRIKRILTSNLGLKIVSVLVACMMWIFVVNVDDPEKVQSFSDVKVEIRNRLLWRGQDIQCSGGYR